MGDVSDTSSEDWIAHPFTLRPIPHRCQKKCSNVSDVPCGARYLERKTIRLQSRKQINAVRFCLVWIVAHVPLYTKRFHLIGCFNTPILSQPADVGNRLSSYASHSASFDQDCTVQRTGWTRESAYYVTGLDAHSVIFPRAQLFRPGNGERKRITILCRNVKFAATELCHWQQTLWNHVSCGWCAFRQQQSKLKGVFHGTCHDLANTMRATIEY